MITYQGWMLLGAAYIGAAAIKLPPTFQKCNVGDLKFKECFKGAVQDAISKMTRPFQAEGLVTFDPLTIPSMTFGAHNRGAVMVEQQFTDIKLYGYSKIRFQAVEVDFDKNSIFLSTEPVLVTLKSRYRLQGRILLLPVQGAGDSVITLENLRINFTAGWTEYQKKGQTHLRVVEGQVTYDPDRVTFNFKNFFNGHKALSDNVNKILNDNWQEVFDDVKKEYEEAYAAIYMRMANGLFVKVPKSEIFGRA